MPRESLEVVIDHPEPMVPPSLVVTVIKETVALLEGVDRALEPGGGISARWAIQRIGMNSPLHITFAPTPVEHDRPMRSISSPLLKDLNTVERGGSPSYINPHLQERARFLLHVVGRAKATIRYSSNGSEARPTAHSIANIEALRHRYTEVGSIEGHLDVINVHGADTVRLWDERFGVPVDCYVTPAQVEDAKDNLRRRVSMRGVIEYEHKRPRRIRSVSDIRPLGAQKELPQIEDIAPVDLSGGEEPADYLRGSDE